MPPEHLLRLNHLVILTSPYSKCTALLNGEMSRYLHQIAALETLKISCEPTSILEHVLRHGPTLRSLELLNYNVLQSRHYAIFSTGQVEVINARCPNLMEFGVEVYSKNDAALIDAIRIDSHVFSNMRNLRGLTLYVYEVDPDWGPLDDLSDNDLANQLGLSVRGWLDAIILAKHGARFEWICLSMMVAHGTHKKVRMRVKWKCEDETGLGGPVVL